MLPYIVNYPGVTFFLGYLSEQGSGVVEPGCKKGREEKAGNEIQYELRGVTADNSHSVAICRAHW
tara:strand:+ start:3347 stop:3541 length:195 start_codon:yes stop_codon:yes gene_type:complete